MPLKFLADECVDYRIVQKLRKEGFEITSVLEDYQGIDDRDVLKVAKEQNAGT